MTRLEEMIEELRFAVVWGADYSLIEEAIEKLEKVQALVALAEVVECLDDRDEAILVLAKIKDLGQ